MTVRVRFAPSPTGELHLGGARTALVNALFARKERGRFVLRIEDTDQDRNVAGAEQRLEDDLRWLGIRPDESPAAGGPYAPYRQSERLPSQYAAFDKLRAAGRVYACFCPPGEAATAGCPARCSELPADEVERRVSAGARPAWRFTLTEDERAIDDALRGRVDFAGAPAPDPVIMRADGRPTFLFAGAIDDADQEITHVIRGEDHLPNAWKQAQMLRAAGRAVPLYAHLPLILGPDRTPLSKRHGHTSIGTVRGAGYPAEAIVMALAHLGMTPPDVTPGTDPWEPLVAHFALERVSAAASVYDQDRLEFLSAAWLRALSPAELALRTLGRTDREALLGARPDPGWWPEALALFAESHATLAGAIEHATAFLQWEGGWSEDGPPPDVLASWRGRWPQEGMTGADQFTEIGKLVGRESGTRGAALFHPLRVALTGSGAGPALSRLAPLFDRAAHEGGALREIVSCVTRIDRARGVR